MVSGESQLIELNAKEKRKSMYIGSGKKYGYLLIIFFIDISCKLNTQNARNMYSERISVPCIMPANLEKSRKLSFLLSFFLSTLFHTVTPRINSLESFESTAAKTILDVKSAAKWVKLALD